jgi:co-chaperonin GroES (HSP10)
MTVAKKKIQPISPPIKPTGHYILIKPEPVERKTAGGIITGTENQLSREHVASVRGTLVAVGENAWKAFDSGQPWAQIGDTVYFKRHVADRIEDKTDIVEGKPQEYFLMSDENLLAIIEE